MRDHSEKGSVAWFKAECDVVDIHHHLHQGLLPSTYSQVTRRIDQVYASHRLVANNLILMSTIGGYDSFFQSDHRPLTIDFDAARFLIPILSNRCLTGYGLSGPMTLYSFDLTSAT